MKQLALLEGKASIMVAYNKIPWAPLNGWVLAKGSRFDRAS
jgi:hypothetical protein